MLWHGIELRPYNIRNVRSRNFPSGGDFPGIIWSVSIANGLVLLVSTLSRGFQVRENSTPQVVGGKLVTGKNAFQVGFKLFQVRGGSGLKSGGSAFGCEKAKKLKGGPEIENGEAKLRKLKTEWNEKAINEGDKGTKGGPGPVFQFSELGRGTTWTKAETE